MSEPTLQEKIAKLPVWARGYIEQLRREAAPNNHIVGEANKRAHEAEKRLRVVNDRLNALEEIMRHAGKGGHETAQAYVDRIINEYKSEPEEDNKPTSAHLDDQGTYP